MKFPTFSKRTNKVFISAATDVLAVGACLLSKYCGAETADIREDIELSITPDLLDTIQVFIRFGSVTTCEMISPTYPVGVLMSRLAMKYGNVFLTFEGKPLRTHMSLSDHGVRNNSTIMASFTMRGGSKSGSPAPITYTDIDTHTPRWEGRSPNGEWVSYVSKQAMACDLFKASQRLQKKTRKRMSSHMKLEIQSFEFAAGEMVLTDFLNKHVDVDILSLVEDLTLLIVQLVRAPTLVDSSLAVITFLKLRTGGSLLCNSANLLDLIISDIAGPTLQADEEEHDLLSSVTSFRDLLNNWESIQDSSIVKKSIKIFRYAAALGLCAQVGIKLDEPTLRACRAEAKGFLAGPNFLVALLDTIALFAQRALMFAKTKTWETFFHGPKSYGQWYDKCMELKRLHIFVGDLESHGSDYHTFVKDLSDSIEQGRSILRFGERSSGYEIVAIKKLLNEMLMIQASMTTYSAAQKSRRPPFSLLVHGSSNVCKSAFVDMLFSYTGQLLNLPISEDFKYSRNPSDPFWSGWNSSKWFVALDDVAYVNPDSPTQDLSLMEIIQLVNDVPMVPNQASLEDKGKNPMRAKVVIATTNTKHLNAVSHFACPLAVQRRLPFVITVEPKPQYAREDAPTMMDSLKVPLITDDYPDFWIITVEKVVPCGTEGRAQFDRVKMFSNIHQFLDWLKDTMEQFQTIQTKASLGATAMNAFKVCKQCNRVKCVCGPTMQALEDYTEIDLSHAYPLPKGGVFGEDFACVHTEYDRTWTYEYKYDTSIAGDHNYILTTTSYVGREKSRRWVTTIRIDPSLVRPVVQTDEVAMAEILAQIVERQTENATRVVDRVVSQGIQTFLGAYMRSGTVRYFTHQAMEWKVCRAIAAVALNRFTNKRGQDRRFYQFVGDSVRDFYITPKWKLVLKGLAVAGAIAATYKAVSYLTRRPRKPTPSECDTEFTPSECPFEEQGLRLSVPDEHFVKSERENVWKRDDYETSTFDKTPLNVSFASLDRDQLLTTVMRNVARIKVSNGVKAKEGNTFCVGGHLWVTNNHTFYEEGDLEVTLEVSPTKVGTSVNTKLRVRQHELFRQPESDLVWFMVYNWETKRDLRDLVSKASLQGEYRGAYIGFDKLRNKQENVVACVRSAHVTIEGLQPEISAWMGKTKNLTVLGDCGMPLIVHKPVAAVLGLHMLGNANQDVWATALNDVKMNEAIAFFGRPIIQCGVPRISADSKPKAIGPVSQYSPLRWMEEGSVEVFGSYTDFRLSSRSKVTSTLLGEEILEERGWDVDAVRPELRDYRPWRHALVDITKQEHGAIDSMLLRTCARGYVDDVLAELKSEDLHNLVVLSTEAAINGIEAVKYIDKMNFNSSMGEPFCKSKKGFLEGEINRKHFNAEITSRIAAIEECYSMGRRACPVFSGQLKDEPRARAKVAAGKVRVFTGAPADWSVVVRKYLLPVVKVIQENPFIFESSPGCAAQTLEWEQYFDYLTTFGVDRLVAGDYGKFDKKMLASLILEAYWILAEILRAAGWTEEELLVVHCIGEDTAYSFVNFGGDLVQFFGSNPSGHPLTVIINCLVNALYLRYCFVQLHPSGDDDYTKVREFKTKVKLLTYGDDNAFGVSKDADWFNHTAIQHKLADIGVEYTMADKTSESRPFIHIREVSYLKREWRWDEDIGAVVCPLDIQSIHKMLTVCVPSKTHSPEMHMADVMVAAANEWFWHGKETFTKEVKYLQDLAERNDLSAELGYKGLPTWDDLRSRFWKSSSGLTTQRLKGCFVEHPRTIVPK